MKRGSVKDELAKIPTAETVLWDGAMMVYHPLLAHKNSGGFYLDPDNCAESLSFETGILPEHKAYAFATIPRGCQSFTLTDLIESASQDMHEDWYESVLDTFSNEIDMCQAMLDKLQEMMSAKHPTWHVDFTKCVVLPVVQPLPDLTDVMLRTAV